MRPEQLKRMRQDLRLSQKAFGELVGVTEQMVSLYERGRSPIPKYLRALAFGLWFENFAGYIPSFTVMLAAHESDIATTIALVDAKPRQRKDVEFLLEQVDRGGA